MEDRVPMRRRIATYEASVLHGWFAYDDRNGPYTLVMIIDGIHNHVVLDCRKWTVEFEVGNV